ncbi:MAG: hypothetical protein HY680_10535 [Chloroflexi bacterium]|nr:hypothetical protein [Chloroflexota bacterium]
MTTETKTPLSEEVLYWLGSKIKMRQEVIAEFQALVAKGTSLQYLAEWRMGKAVEAEEGLKYLDRVKQAGTREALAETIKEIERQVIDAARHGTHRSTDGWTNCSNASKLSAQAWMLSDLKDLLRHQDREAQKKA